MEPGHDLNYLAVAGAMSIPGQLGQPPMRSGLPVADLYSAMFTTVSILAALLARAGTKKGQYIDVSMTDGVFSWESTRLGDYMIDQEMTLAEKNVRGSLTYCMAPPNFVKLSFNFAIFPRHSKKEQTGSV